MIINKVNIKEEVMWAVHGIHGLYVDTAFTRKDMKEKHMASLGYVDWKDCEKRGDRVIKVKVSPIL